MMQVEPRRDSGAPGRGVAVLQTSALPRDLSSVLAALEVALAPGGDPGPPLCLVDPTSAEGRRVTRALAAAGDVGDGATRLVTPTSGSTGVPKLVELTGENVRASVSATAGALGGPQAWLLALPITHVAGQLVVARALLGGLPVRSVAAGEPTVEGFVDGLQRLTRAAGGGTGLATALVPTQLRRLLAQPAGRDALRECSAVLIGGAAIDPALSTGARAAGVRLVTTYGMTESTGGCVYDGRPVGSTTVQIDQERIVLQGPTISPGYLGSTRFCGSFATADRGRLSADGHLTVLGRLDDVVVSGGVNVSLAAVEAAVRGAPGVADCIAVGVDDAEWGQRAAVVVTVRAVPGPSRADRDGDAAVAAQVQRWVRAALDAAHTPVRVVVVERLPLTASGKPDRRAAQALVAGAEIAGVAVAEGPATDRAPR